MTSADRKQMVPCGSVLSFCSSLKEGRGFRVHHPGISSTGPTSVVESPGRQACACKACTKAIRLKQASYK